MSKQKTEQRITQPRAVRPASCCSIKGRVGAFPARPPFEAVESELAKTHMLSGKRPDPGADLRQDIRAPKAAERHHGFARLIRVA
jgi:hypothetical protein